MESASPAAAALVNRAAAWRQILPAPPASRRLRIFATDPGASLELNTAFINEATVEVPWEATRSSDNLVTPGPVGEYLEVVDVDPASARVYDPVDLNNSYLLAQDGLSPSEGNPQFHQQMVYAVAMRTIRNFEIALGRRALWAEREVPVAANDEKAEADGPARTTRAFVRRLRLYPHALREANAYYSPDKRALLFGYFPAENAIESGQIVFTALSHDVVAHETTHALLDGIHRYYQQATNVDVPAFHEAFADIVAIFQHFTFPELLQYEIQRSRGDLKGQGDLMANLAKQFGQAVGQIGQRGALRSAIGTKPSRDEYANAQEPHERGRVLLAAVFDAFLAIYNRRTEDLLRLASGGSGILQPGALHPDLVGRLAEAATKSAQHVLKLSIRALDYMPPVDPRFGDFLRALITADFGSRTKRQVRLPRRLYRSLRRPRHPGRRRANIVAREPALANIATRSTAAGAWRLHSQEYRSGLGCARRPADRMAGSSRSMLRFCTSGSPIRQISRMSRPEPSA